MKSRTKILLIGVLFLSIFTISSCESEEEKRIRLERIEQERIELIKQKEIEDSIRSIQEEKRKKERELYRKYGNNSLQTGATPYSYCFGKNHSCKHYGCSQIKVRTPYNSDVLVTIKKNGKVFRHAYIRANSSYTFEMPNGTYQTFFYYGKGWYPEKIMKKTSCGILKGGFLTDESFGKDFPQTLNNNVLTYELILQKNGNFSTQPSYKNEAF